MNGCSFDVTKREIVDLYEEDFTKIDSSGLAGDIYDDISANLSGNASRYVLASARKGTRADQVVDLIPDILSSYTVNIAYHANNPSVGMALEKDLGRYKLFTTLWRVKHQIIYTRLIFLHQSVIKYVR